MCVPEFMIYYVVEPSCRLFSCCLFNFHFFYFFHLYRKNRRTTPSNWRAVSSLLYWFFFALSLFPLFLPSLLFFAFLPPSHFLPYRFCRSIFLQRLPPAGITIFVLWHAISSSLNICKHPRFQKCTQRISVRFPDVYDAIV